MFDGAPVHADTAGRNCFFVDHQFFREHWNHGCASQRNLAAQVANPADLVQPRAETPQLASRRTTVTEKYRKGETTATQYPDNNKGKISDLGQ